MTTQSGQRAHHSAAVGDHESGPRPDDADHAEIGPIVSVSLAGSIRVDDVLDAVVAGVVVHDDSGHVVSVNEAARGMLTGLPASVLNNAVAQVLTEGGGSARSFTLTTARRDGTPRQLVATSVGHPDATAVITTIRDLSTERRHTDPGAVHRSLDLAQRQLAATFEHSPVGSATLNPHGRLLDGNRVLVRMLGRPRDELAGLSLAEFTHPEDGAREARHYEKLLKRRIDGYEIEKRYLRADGSWIWVRQTMAPVFDSDGTLSHLVMQAQDVSEAVTAVERLTHASRHDPLTGLGNRALLVEEIGRALNRSASNNAPIAVLVCDIDDFRVVNDGIGLGHGDDVLIAVADRLRSATRNDDTVARLGADEFVVLRSQVHSTDEAIGLAQDLLRATRVPIELDGQVLMPTMSVGIALSRGPDEDPAVMLRDAGTALHRAKSTGRGGWDVADEHTRKVARTRLELESQLRTALHENQLRLHLQPITDLRNGDLVGRETLVRWQHPERGLLLPGEFLTVAEQSTLIDDIGAWVLREAGAVKAASDRPGYLAVNVSPAQLSRHGLVDDVRKVLWDGQIEPGDLVIELTESVMLTGSEAGREQLRELDALGVRLVIDDFGTGFSALSHLRDLPVSGIKIDRTFTNGLGVDRQCERIVEALIGMANGMGIDLVAEGVETEQQAEILLNLGCRHAQGYLFGRPQPA